MGSGGEQDEGPSTTVEGLLLRWFDSFFFFFGEDPKLKRHLPAPARAASGLRVEVRKGSSRERGARSAAWGAQPGTPAVVSRVLIPRRGAVRGLLVAGSPASPYLGARASARPPPSWLRPIPSFKLITRSQAGVIIVTERNYILMRYNLRLLLFFFFPL